MADVFPAASGFAGGANKLLVLEVLRHDLPREERAAFARRFEDEGRLAMRLNHPSIVQSYEVGAEQGQSFIAMEYLEGQPFSAVQERAFTSDAQALPGEKLSLEMQLHVLCQVLEGLEYAHCLGDYDGRGLDIVHRDVSPQNVFVTYTGHTKLVDFGIAKTLESHSKTATGVVKGKVPYLSPEQVKGGPVDRRADLFSVGVMLWESVARRRMHGDATLYEILRRLVNGELPALREAVPDVDPELERIVTRALAPEAEQRFPSAAALREELQRFLAGRPKVDPHAIGEIVARDFARERRFIAELIRKEMNEADAPTLRVEHGPAAPLEPALSLLPTHRAPGLRSLDTGPTRVADTVEHLELAGAASERPVATPVHVTLPAGPRRWLAAVAAIGVLSCVAAWGVQRASAVRQATAQARAPGTSAAPRSVSLRIGAYPGDATITLDSEPLPRNPYQGRRGADLGPHTLEVSAPGYLTQRYEVLLDRDLDVDLALLPVPAQVGSSVAAELRRAGALPRAARVPSRLPAAGARP
ncbi:MAG TPA: serine/threonine-protein kinase [Polyangiaceae bacterium]|jgi:serine/threonine-protein kinase|nr:serine/threonine-protein kinase [Polyangiaceae bacterium]